VKYEAEWGEAGNPSDCQIDPTKGWIVIFPYDRPGFCVGRQRYRPRFGKSQAEAGKHRQVGVEPDSLDAANVEWRQGGSGVPGPL
jgi:hypothetical protein